MRGSGSSDPFPDSEYTMLGGPRDFELSSSLDPYIGGAVTRGLESGGVMLTFWSEYLGGGLYPRPCVAERARSLGNVPS